MALKDFLQYFNKTHVKNLEKNFIVLAKKEVTKTEKDIYITKESLVENFCQVFGYRNDSFSKRIYFYLSEGKTKARINFETFMRRCFNLLYGTTTERSKVAFDLYDYDGDGVLNSLDIYELYKNYQIGSKLYQEATILVDDITKKSGYQFFV
jgi:Ca2+-binding EF-hand superfamily protein